MSSFTNFLNGSTNNSSLHYNFRQYYNNYYHGSNSSSDSPSPRTPPNGYTIAPFQFSKVNNSNSNNTSNNNEYSNSSSPYSVSPKTGFLLHKNPNHHHHHSIQEIIRYFGKKMHNWRSGDGANALYGRDRRSSCSEESPKEEEFRGRSKSLDCNTKPKNLSDCEATYRIYNTIMKEGKAIQLNRIYF